MLDKLFYRAVNGKEEITSPIVIKDFNENPYNLTRLLELKEKVKGDKSKHIAREEYSIKQSIMGEKNVIFELKNSDIPMLILHDIRLKIKDYYAVFDFILITKKKIYILKTKKLTGDITITDEGQFIRKVTTKDGKYYKDSLFSPYTQNERGIGQLSSFLSKDFKNVKVDHFVVLANNRSILKKSYAPKEIQDKVIKLDQLILKLKEDYNNSSNSYLEKTMKAMGELISSCHEEIDIDYIAKFKITEDDFKHKNIEVKENEVISPKVTFKTIEEVEKGQIKEKVKEEPKEDIYEALKTMRLKLAKEEGVPAYYIFNNKTLDDLIEKKPTSKEDLLKVFGLSEVKVGKYGEEIIGVIKSTYNK